MSDSTTNTSDRDTRQVAREQGQQVKGSAQQAASNVAGTAGERARVIADEAGGHVRGLADEAQRQVRSRMEQETERAGSALSRAGTQLQALAEGRIDDAGVFGEYAQQAARAVNRWADSVQDRGLDGLLDDMRSFARRRPGTFLFGALAAGVVAGRFGRNLRSEMSGGDNGDRATATAGTTGTRSLQRDTAPTAPREAPPDAAVAGATTPTRPTAERGPVDEPRQVPTAPPPASPGPDRLRDDIGGERREPGDMDVEPADVPRRSLP